ncbi:zinc finger, RING/FYVE/PHD-type [Artemisia annua]|uniref:RING-type E3 ubiquitin transferase n=2 Tax=Artemisia annua TaxID=35608 RepID=A0A2U1KHG4_ARTAN|nr:zinc finger, RING/FYVE/PHD-type [Artemisia annua]
MGHRDMSNQFMISGLHQHASNHPPVEQSYIPMVRTVATDNGHFVAPMDHTLRGGSNSLRNFGGSYNEHHTSFVSMEAQQVPPFLGPPVDPYTHSSTGGNTSVAPMGLVGHFHPSNYSDPGMGHIPAGNGGPFKRKSTSLSEGSSSNFYDAGSSSSSRMLIQKPDVDGLSLPPFRGSSISIDRQSSMRNVRSRSIPELEPCMTRTHVPSYGPHFYQPTTHSANYPVPVHPVNLTADVMSQGWNSVPYAATHGWTTPPDINGPRRETSQFNAGGSSIDINACHRNPFFQGNLASSSQHPHVSRVQSTEDAYSYNSGSITSVYRNGPPSHCNYTNGSRSSTNELHFPFEAISTRYSNYSRAGGWDDGYRNGRPRMAVPRLPPIVDAMGVHERLGRETLTADQLSFYHNSMNFPDQYQDMRLDIDDMSYEELLALEERIGNVSTGLSEEGMFECLSEQVYCSIDQIHEDDSCPICLEEFKNGEKVGRMKKCGHDYHVDCIKKWLVMKKICPVCKSECSNKA